MKETSRSLKVYFIIIGLLGASGSLLQIFIGVAFASTIYTVGALFVSLFYYFLAFLFLYFGIEMHRFLKDSPKTLIGFLIFGLVVNALYGLLLGGVSLASFVTTVVIGCYLIYNINKISKRESDLEEKINKQSTNKQILVTTGILVIVLTVGTVGISTLFTSQKDYLQQVIKEMEEAVEKGEIEELLEEQSRY